MLKKVAIFKALDVEIKKQRGPVAVKEAYRGHHSLKEELSQPLITIIGEVAGGNPLRGQVREAYRPATHGKSLIENGARALSVATDRFLYGAEDKHLSETRAQVKCPIARREFIFEEYQVEESKILGADAIYLMPVLLPVERLQALMKLAMAKGLDVVMEVFSQEDLNRALEAGADIICVVGRDLETWAPSWEKVLALVPKIPSKCLRMVEAGVTTLAQIRQLETMGVHGVVIGDVLLDEFYPGKRLAQILAGIEPPRKSSPKSKKPEAPAPASGPAPAKIPSGKSVPGKPQETAAKSAKNLTLNASSSSLPSNPARKGHKEPQMANDVLNTPAAPAAPAAAPKPAAKKPAAKKAAPKKAAKKAAPKKAAAKKAAPKKAAAKKAAPKKAAKKAAPKKAVKKAAPKKAAAKKAAPKKAVKKAAPKKAAKKAAPKKAAKK